MNMRNLFLTIFLWLSMGLPAQAQDMSDPAQVVQKVTTDVLAAVRQNKANYSKNPEAYFAAIDAVVSSYINFERMAYLVMDATYYRASSAEQRASFVQTFHESLVQTYAKGLLSVDQPNFSVEPVDAPEDAQTVTVKQELRAGSSEFHLDYSMRREADGRWLLVNVVIDGINLGSTFRNQFAQSARKFGGDLDLVIATWSTAE
jgi:phospholipid transport system substrate-binding protein